MKLLHDCRSDVETIENGIEANNEQIKAIGYLRNDIVTYNKTKAIYKQYKDTTIFKERFRKKHEDEITDHEIAKLNLQRQQKPLPKIKELDERLARLKSANVNNYKALKSKRAEYKELKNIHGYLFELRLTHEPPPPPRERTKKRSLDIDR